MQYLAALVCLLGLAGAQPVANTTFGKVVGFSRNNVDVWWNIPYAAAPVGNLRFRPPVDPQPWVSALDCTTTPRMCPQNHNNKTHRFTGEEDCLIVNVYAPRNRTEPLPVMAFIHGGGFNSGSGYSYGVPLPDLDQLYDGEKLAVQNNVVVVTMNYRLAILGFLAMKELAAEQPDGTNGNYGLQDQRKALQWIQKNVASFGGDRNRVLLYGESAGGTSVCYHLTSPASKGLFSAVMAESPVCSGRIPFADLAVAQNFGLLWAKYFKCDYPSGEQTLACLRALSTEQILDYSDDTPSILPPNPPNAPPLPLLLPVNPWWPVIDGAPSGVEKRPIEMIQSGKFNNVPTAMGTNRDEGTLFVPLVQQVLPNITLPLSQKEYNEILLYFFLGNQTTVDAIDTEYQPDTPHYTHRLADVLRDFIFICPVRSVMRAINVQRAAMNDEKTQSFLYSFNRTLTDFPLWSVVRDFHGVELFYVFDRPVPYLWKWTPDDQTLSGEMEAYWSGLATTGNPNSNLQRCPTCIQWPQYTAKVDGAGDDNIVLKHNLLIEHGLFQDHCNFWDKIGYN
eukprot:TRINITY_DN17430_c0_g1_i1.p1 TRINITY_DN17430_c0_g1~~TRINITY_DN17430_c0_g1_i1.p1  ORF type:complete len:563 (-),score=108.74 TRINITY_DN17430_c0_g1_i1:10-1698(-)